MHQAQYVTAVTAHADEETNLQFGGKVLKIEELQIECIAM